MAIFCHVAGRSPFHFYIGDEQRDGLRVVKERDGVSESEQIRRAIDAWLEAKDVTKKKRPAVAPKRGGQA